MIELYDTLADIFEYPDYRYATRLAACTGQLLIHAPQALESFASFRHPIEELSKAERQELYIRTFELSPVCALEIGYHLFGESYKRGVFLANLRWTEKDFDLGQEEQLPDYLPVLLRLLGRLEASDLRDSLRRECLIPALEKMATALEEADNPYRPLFDALIAVLDNERAATVSSATNEFAMEDHHA